MLERLFGLRENRTDIRTEVLAGVTTFMTMAYILFVQPAVLSTDFAGRPTGLSHDAVLLATCIASCLACLLMGFLANYPIAQAPGMGENFFFVSVVMGLSAAGFADAWKVATEQRMRSVEARSGPSVLHRVGHIPISTQRFATPMALRSQQAIPSKQLSGSTVQSETMHVCVMNVSQKAAS